jgi:hypothetical protein
MAAGIACILHYLDLDPLLSCPPATAAARLPM